MNKFIDYIKKSTHYYTIWAIIMHTLYAFNLIDSTYHVALFVLVIGNVIGFKNYFIDKTLPLEWFLILIIQHGLPFFILNFEKKQNNILYVSLCLYLLYNYKNIVNCYKDIYGYFCKKTKS